MRRPTPRHVTAAAVMALMLTSGCGGSDPGEPDPRQMIPKVVAAYFKAIRLGDCQTLARLQAGDFEARLAACEQDPPEPQAAEVTPDDVEDVEVDGERASATVTLDDGAHTTVRRLELRRSAGIWQIVGD